MKDREIKNVSILLIVLVVIALLSIQHLTKLYIVGELRNNKSYFDGKNFIVHTVKDGDSINSIAKKYDYTSIQLLSVLDNNWIEKYFLVSPGSKLKIPSIDNDAYYIAPHVF